MISTTCFGRAGGSQEAGTSPGLQILLGLVPACGSPELFQEGSSPTFRPIIRISSRALLFSTTPGRIR